MKNRMRYLRCAEYNIFRVNVPATEWVYRDRRGKFAAVDGLKKVMMADSPSSDHVVVFRTLPDLIFDSTENRWVAYCLGWWHTREEAEQIGEPIEYENSHRED